MTRPRSAALFLLVAIACVAAPFARHPAEAAEQPGCAHVEQAGGRYIACRFDPAMAHITLHDLDAAGRPYGGFDPLFRAMLAKGQLPVFAMNGGMYEANLGPVGLYVEQGRQLKAANTRNGYGNFHLKPNGVFWIGGGKAAVEETGAYLAHRRQPDYATQSGPMLVRHGRLHPTFKPDSDSLKIRNGVGVDRSGGVHFVVSEDPVRFYDMAALFRDRLGCPDALFLDGTISSLYAPELGRFDRLFPMGPMIAVTVQLPWPR